jgi:hypothetical protein
MKNKIIWHDIMVVLACVAFASIASFFSVITAPSHSPTLASQSSTWKTAKKDQLTGEAMVVDARLPGDLPEIPTDARLDPSSSEEELREFCQFAGDQKIYIFCSSSTCGASRNLAQRMKNLCQGAVFYIEGGAEKWPGN